MNKKTLLIISREYLTRIQKKSFIILTILMPILMAALILLPTLLLLRSEKKQFSNVLVVDDTDIFVNKFTDNDNVAFHYRSGDIETIKKESLGKDYDVVLHILDNSQALKANLFYNKSIPSSLQSNIESSMDDILFDKMLQDSLNVQPKRFENLKNLAKADVTTIQIDDKGEEKELHSEVNQLFGMACGFIIYFIIVIFASQVLRGVLEEKLNRVVEVLVSTVKPTQLLVGKIVGIALVGLTQLFVWIVLSVAIIAGIQFLAPGLMNQDAAVQDVAATAQMVSENATPEEAFNLFQMIQNYFSVSFGTIIVCFLFFFVVGYLIYSTLYAATGSVVDNESDSQQYTLPITLPLLLSIILVPTISSDPSGSLAFWFSMIPLTSPIAMMVRLPSGVPAWELLLSMGLAVAFLVLSIYVSAKIYRIGILTYGKKPSWKTIFKWLKS